MQLKERAKSLIGTVNSVAFLVLFFFNNHSISAQLTENSWIVPEQKYVKLTVNDDGIYRVRGEELQAAGWILNDINVRNLQLFHRGKEVSIYSTISNNTKFKSTDSIFFYGQKNDGSRDSLLYRNTERANPYHSLYSDESAYFLTVGTKPGKRINIKTSKETNILDEAFHLTEEVTVFDEQFSFNNIIGLVPLLQQSYFEEGEGRTGKYIVSDSVAKFSIRFQNRVVSADHQPIIEYRINGRSRVNHSLVSTFSPKDSTYFKLTPFGFTTQKKRLDNTLVNDETTNFSLISTQKVAFDWYSMTYIKVIYPQRFLMNNAEIKYFTLGNDSSSQKAIRVTDLKKDGFVWDITNPAEPTWIQPTTQDRYVVDNIKDSVRLVAVTTLKSVNKISTVNFRDFQEVADYLIITHESLLTSAKTYATYRASNAGGNFKPFVTTTQELYDTFNFGESSPIALRQFAAFMLKTQKPKHLLLLGSGVSFPDELRKNNFPNLVPTIGYPGSDALISAGLGTFPTDIQAIPTGRLNVTKNEEVLNYLEKVQTTEANLTPDSWQKSLLHLSGGQSENEITNLSAILNNIELTAKQGLLGGKIDSRRKRTNQEIEPIDISKAVNKGLGMITFVGHGSANQIDLNIGYCSPPENGFTNEGKYPVMFFNGCGVGNVFYRYNALSTDWLLTPKKGAIAVFANSFWSYAYPTQQYLNALYKKLFDDPSTTNLTLGEIQQATHLQLLTENPNEYIRANVHQMILQGDPALRIFQIEKPDYKVAGNNLFISSVNQSQVISKNDSIKVGAIIQNTGRYVKNSNIPVQLEKTFRDGSTTTISSAMKAVAYQDTVFFTIKNEINLAELKVHINPRGQIVEYSYDNNSGILKFQDWNAIGQLTSFPDNILPDNLPPTLSVKFGNKLLENGGFISLPTELQLELTDNNILDSTDDYHFTILVKECKSCGFKELKLPQKLTTTTPLNLLKTSLVLLDLSAGTYELKVNARDVAGNRIDEPYQIQFQVSAEKLPIDIIAYPNPGKDFVQVRYNIVDSKVPAKAELFVYNNIGQIIYTDENRSSTGQNSFFINTKNLPSGRFFVKLVIDEAIIATTSFIIK